MHDAIFATQDRWATQATSNPRGIIDPLAERLGLDMSRYDTCMDTQKYVAHIQAHRQAAQRYRVQSTPSFVIGGRVIAGSLPYDEFKRYVEQAATAAGVTPPPTKAPQLRPPAGND
jgi:protein-disulfide isomerase